MDWHARYLQQAAWTRDLRAYLFEQAGLSAARRVLEVGCGTGAILQGLNTSAARYGLDVDAPALAQCRVHATRAALTNADGQILPYPDQTFEIVYCHYYLLWVADPVRAVREMQRVTRPGGHLLALAEPDYGARRDEPAALQVLGQWQRQALRQQGADPGLGARLAEIFYQAGLQLRETGPIQSRNRAPQPDEWDLEWAVLEADLAGWAPAAELQRLKALDRQAWAEGTRVLEVPTYFAWGQRT